ATRPLRHRQGRRDPHAATRSRGAAPRQPTTNLHLARPRRTQRIEQTASGPAAAAATGVTPNAAALARPARRPPLDLPAPTTRPTTHRTPDPGSGAADGPRESPLGLPTNSRRVGRTRPYLGRLDRLDDPQDAGEASRRSKNSGQSPTAEWVHVFRLNPNIRPRARAFRATPRGTSPAPAPPE